MSERYVTLQEAADHFSTTPRTIRTDAANGKFPIYRMPGGRGLRVRVSEIEQAYMPVPTLGGF